MPVAAPFELLHLQRTGFLKLSSFTPLFSHSITLCSPFRTPSRSEPTLGPPLSSTNHPSSSSSHLVTDAPNPSAQSWTQFWWEA